MRWQHAVSPAGRGDGTLAAASPPGPAEPSQVAGASGAIPHSAGRGLSGWSSGQSDAHAGLVSRLHRPGPADRSEALCPRDPSTLAACTREARSLGC
jgi:hypothetical protein